MLFSFSYYSVCTFSSNDMTKAESLITASTTLLSLPIILRFFLSLFSIRLLLYEIVDLAWGRSVDLLPLVLAFDIGSPLPFLFTFHESVLFFLFTIQSLSFLCFRHMKSSLLFLWKLDLWTIPFNQWFRQLVRISPFLFWFIKCHEVWIALYFAYDVFVIIFCVDFSLFDSLFRCSLSKNWLDKGWSQGFFGDRCVLLSLINCDIETC